MPVLSSAGAQSGQVAGGSHPADTVDNKSAGLFGSKSPGLFGSKSPELFGSILNTSASSPLLSAVPEVNIYALHADAKSGFAGCASQRALFQSFRILAPSDWLDPCAGR